MERSSFYLFGEGDKPFYNGDDPLTEIHVGRRRDETRVQKTRLLSPIVASLGIYKIYNYQRKDSSSPLSTNKMTHYNKLSEVSHNPKITSWRFRVKIHRIYPFYSYVTSSGPFYKYVLADEEVRVKSSSLEFLIACNREK
ncbi:hypothetical protein YC2023_051102 [Brassica napus]